jgi:signal transduction histidine kinase
MGCDGTCIAQAFLNVLSNAIKITPIDGNRIVAKASTGVVEIKIADTGININDAGITRFMQLFEQAAEISPSNMRMSAWASPSP